MEKEICEYLEKAHQGEIDAQYLLAKYYESIDEKELAFLWYCKAANGGHVKALYETARHYSLGYGIQKDKNLAVTWYLKAAEAGHIEAQFKIANFYFYGETLPLDLHSANYWFIKVSLNKSLGSKAEELKMCADESISFITALNLAECGDVESQVKIAECYYYGEGIRSNKEKAFIWYEKAAKQGHPEANIMHALCFLHGVPFYDRFTLSS